MPTVKSELQNLVQLAGAALVLPPVRRVYIPEPDPERQYTEFGVVMLDDGSAGLYYAWMGASQTGMSEKFHERDFAGKSPLDLAALYDSEDEAERSIGLAAINAITQHVFRRSAFALSAAGDSTGALEFSPQDHVGMVGYFPSLVDRLRRRGIRLTVIEKKSKFIESGGLVNVTLDADRLDSCNKIILTAATMLNDTIDSMLDLAAGAAQIVMIGPTAGFFPDPLFSKRVTAVGGTRIVLPGELIERLAAGVGMGDAASKYLIEKDYYPGARDLLNRVQ
jgi:uncharacterized protein (DUF4213/DUF364 family)